MNRAIVVLSGMLFIIICSLTFQRTSEACSRLGKVNLSHTCNIAEYIVRATAVEYARPPIPFHQTRGVPESKVRFKIEEVLKGDSLTGTIVLNGFLTDKDDFNDQSVPYPGVRLGGRHGNCYAFNYKQGAQYLLFLKKASHIKWPRATTVFTVDIDPVAPVNEQLHSSDDPWVYYIKGLVRELSENQKTGK